MHVHFSCIFAVCLCIIPDESVSVRLKGAEKRGKAEERASVRGREEDIHSPLWLAGAEAQGRAAPGSDGERRSALLHVKILSMTRQATLGPGVEPVL